MLACLCGVPLALWLPAVALTSWPAFRNTHMPAPPEEAASQGGAVPEPSSGAVGAAAEPVGGEAEVAAHPAGSKKED